MEETLAVMALKESVECLREDNIRLRKNNKVLRSIISQLRRKLDELETDALAMHQHIVEHCTEEDLDEQDETS